MAFEAVQEKYIPRDNDFYRKHYHHVIYVLIFLIVLMMGAVGFVLYQMSNRPLPEFHALQPDNERMKLAPFTSPNLLADTIIRWASKGATISYTFGFSDYNYQLDLARPYFTTNGWNDYLATVRDLIENIVESQLIVNGVVSGAPVISNQGPIPGKGYSWRVQIPFLVTYQSANIAVKRNFLVVLTIVKVPTVENPQGIGIDQFVMVQR